MVTGTWIFDVEKFPHVGNSHPNWLSYFSEGVKPPTRLSIHVFSELHRLQLRLKISTPGRVGAGKSSLINALRGLSPQDSEAAAVGVGHTTKRPKPYSFTGDLASLAKKLGENLRRNSVDLGEKRSRNRKEEAFESSIISETVRLNIIESLKIWNARNAPRKAWLV